MLEEYIRYYLTEDQEEQERLFNKLPQDKQNAIARAKLKLLREGEKADEEPVSDRGTTRDDNILKERDRYRQDLEAAEKAAKERKDILANKIPSLVEAIHKGMGKPTVTADTSIDELSAILTAFKEQDIEGLDAAKQDFIQKFKTPTDKVVDGKKTATYVDPLEYKGKKVIMTIGNKRKPSTIYQLPQGGDQAPDLGKAWPEGKWERRLALRKDNKTFDNYLKFIPSEDVEFTKLGGSGKITIGPGPPKEKFKYLLFRSIKQFEEGTPDYPPLTREKKDKNTRNTIKPAVDNRVKVPFLPKWLAWGPHTEKGSANKGKGHGKQKERHRGKF